MNRLIAHLASTLLFIILIIISVFARAHTPSSFHEAKELSQKEGKNILALVTDDSADKLQYSGNSLEGHFDNYIHLQLVTNTFEGSTLAEHFKIEHFPSLLVFDSSGKVIKRTNQDLSLEELEVFLATITSHRPPSPETIPAETVDETSDMNTETNLPGEVDEHNATVDKRNAVTDEPEIVEEISTVEEDENTVMNSGETTRFFTLQTGVFSSKDNAEKQARELSRLFNEDINIIASNAENKELYSVFLGAYPSKRKAARMKLLLLDYNLKGVIKNLPSSRKM